MGEHPTTAEIDLQALDQNLAQAVFCARGRPILGVVKANAYGHGALPLARRLSIRGVQMLGVAFLNEGIELREGGITLPVLLLAGCFREEVAEVFEHRLIPVVYDQSVVEALGRVASSRGGVCPVHVKADTGMGRIGLREKEILSFVERAAATMGIRVEGVLSHFSEADIEDRSSASEQIRRMREIRQGLMDRGIQIPFYHMANSAAVMDLPAAHLDLVRPGLMLYGYSPFEKRSPLALRPILGWFTRISALKRVPAGTPISYGRTFVTQRESLIATVPIGYADGYPRSLSNRGEMIVRGIRVPVVGRVCMDMLMLDVTEVPGLSAHERVTVLGEDGGESIFADELARRSGTIPYEILCGIGRRVARYYRDPGEGTAGSKGG